MKEKTRIAYIDVAKGLLMLCLLYGHMMIEISWHGVDNHALTMMWRFVPLYNAFFMQTFFIITGLCTSFNTSFGKYLWKNVKTLIIPAIIISIIGYIGTDINRGHCAFSQHASGMMRWLFTESGPWFIISLFWVKMIYWCLFRLSLKAQTWIVVILYLCGLLLHTYDVGDNIQWHRHALMMMPYMFLGRLLKDHMELLDRYINRLALAAAILLPAQFLLYLHCNYSIPMHDRGIYVSFQNFPIHFCNVILGTSATFWLARKLQDSNWLKIFGAGSLLIYLINEPQQRFILKFMMPLYDPNMCTGLCYLWNTVTYLLCVAVFLVVVKVVYSNKYLSYLVGKW